MTDKEKEEKYIEYKLKGLLDSKPLFKKEHPEYEESITLMSAFRDKYKITVEEYEKIVDANLDIQNIKNKFSKERKEGFKNIINFYKWYKKQPQECCYCGTTQEELNKIFSNKKIESKKFTETLHIERYDSNKLYSEDNCGLACSLCNNAKSDMISKDDFKTHFKDAFKAYLKDKYSEAIK